MSGAPAGDVPAGHLRDTVTYLQMIARPPAARAAPALPPGCRIERVLEPRTAFYRFLYETVGEPWMWAERRRWSDEALATRIAGQGTEVLLLSCDGQPAGFAELDRRAPGEVELVHLGLLPDFIGRRLGAPLLRTAIGRAWTAGVRRVWLHTCDLDHPAAQDLYRREGFTPYRTETKIVRDPRASGLLPRHVQPHRPIVE